MVFHGVCTTTSEQMPLFVAIVSLDASGTQPGYLPNRAGPVVSRGSGGKRGSSVVSRGSGETRRRCVVLLVSTTSGEEQGAREQGGRRQGAAATEKNDGLQRCILLPVTPQRRISQLPLVFSRFLLASGMNGWLLNLRAWSKFCPTSNSHNSETASTALLSYL